MEDSDTLREMQLSERFLLSSSSSSSLVFSSPFLHIPRFFICLLFSSLTRLGVEETITLLLSLPPLCDYSLLP
jgi:hypothetical protein